MRNLTLLLLALFALSLTACHDDDQDDCAPVTTDSDANLDEFLGVWYEIATFPQIFSAGCECTTATYTLADDGASVNVFNSCRVLGFPNEIEGTAVAPDPTDFSKLLVSFPVSPVPGDYWIIEFGDGGSYMLVGNPDRDQLFVLSRTPQMDEDIYDDLLDIAEEMCFDVDALELTPQTCSD